MSLYLPNDATGYMHAGAVELDRKLKEGDGLIWAGDPDLDLHMGVVTERATGQIKARCYEVWRYCEDGQERMIGRWRLEEFDRILLDVSIMKAGATGRITDAQTRIDAANAATEKDQQDKFVDKLGETLDHALRLEHDREEGLNRFYMNDIKRDDDAVND